MRDDLEQAKAAWANSPARTVLPNFEKENREISIEVNKKNVKPLKEIFEELPPMKGFYHFDKNVLNIRYFAAKAFCEFTEPLYKFLTDLKVATEEDM